MPPSSTVSRRSSNRGFSILEVLITAVIIGVITGIIALRYGSFNNLILLKNQAFVIALDLRETQTSSLSAVGSEAEFRRPYGIHFDTAQADRYTFFRDSNEDGLFTAAEALEVRRLDSRFQIRRICGGSSASCTSLEDLTVTFERPNFDAILRSGALLVTNGVVEIETMSGSSMRGININAAGQITVE